MPPILKIRAELAIPMHTPEDLQVAGQLLSTIRDYLASTPGLVVTKWDSDITTPRKVPVSCLEVPDPRQAWAHCQKCGQAWPELGLEDDVCPDCREASDFNVKATAIPDLPPALDRRQDDEVAG